MKISFDSRTIEEPAAILDTDLQTGLGVGEAQKRLKENGENRIYDYRVPVFSGIGTLFLDLSSVLLLVAMLVCALLSHRDYALLIGAAWAANRLICGLAYLLRVRGHYAAALSRIPHSRVIRDGKIRLVDSRHLVPGDIVLLAAGDAVCFDGKIIRSSVFFAAGAAGLSASADTVLAGTLVSSGEARVIVTATGENTRAVSQNGLLPFPSTDHGNTGYSRIKHAVLTAKSMPLEAVCRIQGIASAAFVLLAVGYALLSGMQGEALLTVFVSAACAIASSFSDLLFAGWNCGLSQIRREYDEDAVSPRTVRLLSEERLPELQDADSVFMPLSFLAGRDGFQVYTLVTPNGTITDLPVTAKPNRETARLSYALADAALHFSSRKNPLFEAVARDLNAVCRRCGLATGTLTVPWSAYADAATGFDAMQTLRDGRRTLAVTGNAEAVLRCCSYFEDGGEKVKISEATASGLTSILRHYRGCGYFVSAVAFAPASESAPTRLSAVCQDMELLGFCVYGFRQSAGAADFLRECLEKKIRVRLFADGGIPAQANTNAETALDICGSLGLDRKRLRIYTSCDPAAEPDSHWLDCGLYIGCSALQKQKLLTLARGNGEKCVCFSDNAGEAGCLAAADFAVSAIPHRKIHGGCDALYFVSHAAVAESPMRLLQLRESIGGLQAALSRAIRLLCTAQAARFLWFLISLFAFHSAPAPGGILLSGLLLDLLLTFSSVEVMPKGSGPDRRGGRAALGTFDSWLPAFSASGIWAVMSLAAYAFLRLLSVPASYSTIALLSVTLFSAALTLLPPTGEKSGVRRPAVSSLLTVLLVCVIAVGSWLLPDVGIMLSGFTVRWTELAASAVAAAVSVFLSHSLALSWQKRLHTDRE